jgi:PAS domain S-box-containing protein
MRQRLRENERDVRALQKSEERYHSLFENMLNGFALHEIIVDEKGLPVDYVFLDVNDAFENLTGLKQENLIGKRVTEALPGIERDAANWIGRYGAVALGGEEIRFESFFEPLNKWYSIYAYRPAVNQFVTILEDITSRKRSEVALQKAQEEVRTLRGILPICSSCKKIRDDKGCWNQIEVYIRDRTEADFSHGVCPECMKKLYPEYNPEDQGA